VPQLRRQDAQYARTSLVGSPAQREAAALRRPGRPIGALRAPVRRHRLR
jgi:hypothetical protein